MQATQATASQRGIACVQKPGSVIVHCTHVPPSLSASQASRPFCWQLERVRHSLVELSGDEASPRSGGEASPRGRRRGWRVCLARRPVRSTVEPGPVNAQGEFGRNGAHDRGWARDRHRDRSIWRVASRTVPKSGGVHYGAHVHRSMRQVALRSLRSQQAPTCSISTAKAPVGSRVRTAASTTMPPLPMAGRYWAWGLQ